MNDRDEIFSAVTVIFVLVIVAVAPFFYCIEDEPETPLKANKRVIGHVQCLITSLEMPDVSYALEFKAAKEEAFTKMAEPNKIISRLDDIELPVVTLELESLGKYYVTGYTSLECGGSTTTASGTTCHKAASYEDSFYNPTTCAADVWGGYHDFGDTLFVEEFGCFTVEDTGSAVLGKHIDLYFWDNEYNYALSITGYYEVYSVEFIYSTVQANKYDIQKLVANKVIGWKIKEV